MSIINMINQLKSNFTRDTGLTPTYVYVGTTQYKTLILLASQNAIFNPGNTNIEDGKIKVYGLELLMVNTESHLRVS